MAEGKDLVEQMHLFNSVLSMDDIDFHVDTTPRFPLLDDVFNISNICLPQVSVNSDFHTYKDVTLDVICTPYPSPSHVAHISTSMWNKYLMYRDT